MMVSTKGRYALRILIDLGQHMGDGFISLKDIAQRQEVSVKYLEMIVGVLNRAGLVDSARGKTGGYKLNRPPEKYTIGSIIKLTEGDLNPVNCKGCGDGTCDRSNGCLTMPIWAGLGDLIDDYLESITLADVLTRTSFSDKDPAVINNNY